MSFRHLPGKKKSLFYCVVLCILYHLCGVSASMAFDTFSGAAMDDTKWQQPEYVREISGSQLVLKAANRSGSTSSRVNTYLINPGTITDIECMMTLSSSTNVDTGSGVESAARIDGFFYNTQSGGGVAGDIWAGVKIGDRGAGLESWWEVYEVVSSDYSMEEKSTGTIIAPGTLAYDTPYPAKLSYDGANGFTFTINGVTASYTSGPARAAAAYTNSKGISASAYGSAGDAYTSVSFDDVTLNSSATVYDDFSSSPLDPAKWTSREEVRDLSDGKIRLNIQAKDAQAQSNLYLLNQDVDYLEAKFSVKSDSTISSGARGIIRIAGYYYNETGVYNGYQNDVWADIRITLRDDQSLDAACYLSKMLTSDEYGPSQDLLDQSFTGPFSFDREYVLSIEKSGSQIIFRLDDETITYTVTTPMYTPSIGAHRQIRTRVYADQGETGYMKATVDDVFTSKNESAAQKIQTQAAEIYVATFERAPDYSGLMYWVGQVQNGALTIDQVAQSFFNQPETMAKYDDNTTNAQFITTVYQNILSRDPDAAGLAYWVSELDQGTFRRDQAIMALINGAKAATGSAADAAMLSNKTQVGSYFANSSAGDLASNSNFMTWAQAVMDFATATSTGIDSARAYIEQLDIN